MVYATDQPDIVECAKKFYKTYPTIENNIPKEKSIYDGDYKNFAKVDNTLSDARMSIGLSSNLSQLSLSYSYNSSNSVFDDYTCILSVVA